MCVLNKIYEAYDAPQAAYAQRSIVLAAAVLVYVSSLVPRPCLVSYPDLEYILIETAPTVYYRLYAQICIRRNLVARASVHKSVVAVRNIVSEQLGILKTGTLTNNAILYQ